MVVPHIQLVGVGPPPGRIIKSIRRLQLNVYNPLFDKSARIIRRHRKVNAVIVHNTLGGVSLIDDESLDVVAASAGDYVLAGASLSSVTMRLCHGRVPDENHTKEYDTRATASPVSTRLSSTLWSDDMANPSPRAAHPDTAGSPCTGLPRLRIRARCSRCSRRP